ncbi:MAG TPA: hypothetical protein V6C90_00305 [Coleofasciculaceae cyanobacterium]
MKLVDKLGDRLCRVSNRPNLLAIKRKKKSFSLWNLTTTIAVLN